MTCSNSKIPTATNGACSISGCWRDSVTRGYCGLHYSRLLYFGAPLAGPPFRRTRKGEPYRWLMEHVDHVGEDCLCWPFAFDNKGYGQLIPGIGLGRGTRPIKASRFMCIQAHGDPPARHEAAHWCGNRWCVNPQHLRWATPEENQADKIVHGTTNRGRPGTHAKLTEDQVRQIRSLAGIESQGRMGKRFNVSRNTIASIIRGSNWAWLK